MDIDDNDDDFYAPEETAAPATSAAPQETASAAPEQTASDTKQEANEDLEEGEEEDEGGAMDEDDSSDDVCLLQPTEQCFSPKLIHPFPEHDHYHREKRWHISSTTIVCYSQPSTPFFPSKLTHR